MNKIKKQAIDNNIPIIDDAGLEYLLKIIKEKEPKNILEIGSAIGYSAIEMAKVNGAKVITIERNENLVKLAKENIAYENLENQITVILDDALNFDNSKMGEFELIYIDAAKAQNKSFFEKYVSNLALGGIIIIDNLNFHDLRKNPQLIETRNVRQLIRKINNFIDYMNNNNEYDFEIIDVGDGLGLIKKRDQNG